MYRVFAILILLFFASSTASAEVIKNFSSEYTINSDASVLVEETIVYDFEQNFKHGIFRIIEKNHPQPATVWYKNRYIDIDLLSVTKNGFSEPYNVIDRNSEVEFKIGNPNEVVTGRQVYKITYKLTGALSYGDMGTEFYWNVTGNDWPVAILEAKGVVRTESSDIFSGTNDCYQGGFGSVNACTDLYKGENTAVFTAKDLSVGEGLTIATGINSQTVAKVVNENFSYLLLLFLFSTSWLIFAIYKTYKFRIENKVDLPVIAQYEPYENYLPMYTGVLLDGRLDPRDITAGILYLAEQGFIKIRKTENKVLLFIPVDDYEITLLRPVSEMPNNFLQSLSGLMFGFYDTPPKTVMLSSLTENKGKNYATIISLEKSLKKDITNSGFNVYSWPKFANWLIVVPVLLLVFGIFSEDSNIWPLLLFVIILTGVMIGIIVQAKYTQRGYEAKNYLEGFKLFLSVTDKERFAFHNAPKKNPELFMKYLPYAVAFGVEDEWVKVFDDIAIPQPVWYEGVNNNFSAHSFTKDMGIFSNSIAVSIKTPATSGISGSSGGGFSGGGGGRGGGGSW